MSSNAMWLENNPYFKDEDTLIIKEGEHIIPRKDAMNYFSFKYQGKIMKFDWDDVVRRFKLHSVRTKEDGEVPFEVFQVRDNGTIQVGKWKITVKPLDYVVVFPDNKLRAMTAETFEKYYKKTYNDEDRKIHSKKIKIKKK